MKLLNSSPSDIPNAASFERRKRQTATRSVCDWPEKQIPDCQHPQAHAEQHSGATEEARVIVAIVKVFCWVYHGIIQFWEGRL